MKIYILTHKSFIPPNEKNYIPLQVGASLHAPLGYLMDSIGDNISDRNPLYSELTGLYWVWKNDLESDIVGFAHYRRYLLNEDSRLYQTEEVTRLLTTYNVITTRVVELDYSYYEAFQGRHHKRDLDILSKVMSELHPDQYPLFEKLIHENHTHFGNMFLMKRQDFHTYMEFLFPILFAMEKEVDMTGYDGYQKRLYGFVSEFLLFFWVQQNGLSVKESLVGMLGEKTEISEVKEAVDYHFKQKNLAGAKQAFLSIYQKRPDILMEASDVHRECRLTMQAISSMEQEEAKYGWCRLDKMNELSELIPFYRKLNQITGRYRNAADSLKKLLQLPLADWERSFLQEHQVSEEEVRVSFLLQQTPAT